jgi:hypothetical protein
VDRSSPIISSVDRAALQIILSSEEWTFQGPPAVYAEDQKYSHMKLDLLIHRSYS